MQWNILHTISESGRDERRLSIIESLMRQRGFLDSEAIEAFLKPKDPMSYAPESVGIDRKQLSLACSRLRTCIAEKQPIIIFGDYDADGITATAILWEALHSLGAVATPFIPLREKHGYGLSTDGIKDALQLYEENQMLPLVITVDNGVVAHEAADYLAGQGIELIVTDHHQLADTIPTCLALVHSDVIAGSAVAWMLAKELSMEAATKSLDLVAIGTVADMMPLKGFNRAVVRAGLPKLSSTPRLGLRALYKEAAITMGDDFSTYHINYVIAPRLNAMGRLSKAMESLRLLCTTNKERARDLAELLGDTNRMRQDLTVQAIDLAITQAEKQDAKIIVIDGDDYHEGVIGLVASKLVERLYKPVLVIQRNGKMSKGSGRSVAGVHLIELIRRHGDLLINAGGHPMAAGFSIETDKIEAFRNAIQQDAVEQISDVCLERSLKVDCELTVDDIDDDLFYALEDLKPFGIGNSRPVFALLQAHVSPMQLIGKEKKHIKMNVLAPDRSYAAIGFNMAHLYHECGHAKRLNIAFSLDENVWNGRRSLQLRLRDVTVG